MTVERSAKEQRAVTYLQRALRRNPLYESERIIRSRASALGIKKSQPAVEPDNLARQRDKIRQQLDAIRADCWTKPVEPLQQQLARLPLDGHPDLERTAERLRVILAHRNKLPALTSHSHFDEKFLSCFKQILTLPPRELAIPREQVVASFRNRKLRRRGIKMIALLEQEVPALCQLEQKWLDSLKRQRVNRDIVIGTNTATAMKNAMPEISGWWLWAMILGSLLLRAIFGNRE